MNTINTVNQTTHKTTTPFVIKYSPLIVPVYETKTITCPNGTTIVIPKPIKLYTDYICGSINSVRKTS